MDTLIEYPTPWTLPDSSPFARQATRPPIHRPPGFDQQFDSKTIFYDSVFVKDRGALVLQGPPWLNLQRHFRHLCLSDPDRMKELKVSIREGDRHLQLWAAVQQPIEAVRILSELGECELEVNSDRHEFFRGMRVLLTLSKDNPLDWVCDWIRFHRDVHGANAVLLYDNASTVYSPNELLSRLQTLPGIDRVCIVSWPFRYGPNGRKGFWDSDFCQHGALENARWRFLQKAKSVLSCDIDELVVTRGKSVFELAETSKPGYINFYGKWIVGVNEQSIEQRHAGFHYVSRSLGRCPTKWAAVPARCPPTAQWKVHVIGSTVNEMSASTACYRHFRQINTHWKYDRSRRERLDPARHYRDAELAAAFDKVRWDR